MPKKEKQKILIIDDDKDSVKLLYFFLTYQYKLYFSLESKQGYKLAQKVRPDLILLDIFMPGMNGYEVCQKLKQNKDTEQIPVIFITGANTEAEEIKGLEYGAVDYLSKPLSAPIVKARIHNHLKLAQTLQEIIKTNSLREDIEQITRHDLKTPLNGILGLSQILLDNPDLSDDDKEILEAIESSSYSMQDLINRSLDLMKIENGTYLYHPIEINLIDIIFRIKAGITKLSEAKQINIEFLVNGELAKKESEFIALGDASLTYSMLGNLISNALEASPNNETLGIHCYNSHKNCKITITNKGAIPKEIRSTFFNKYVTHEKLGGTGIGAYSAKLIANMQLGDITFSVSDAENSTTLDVLLKR
jgi:two-component system, sensor histidine kinase and response regulator